MTRQVQVILVCEDSQHEAFARRFLSLQGYSERKIRVLKAPAGKGAGEQFVREQFPKELRSYRARRNRVTHVVIVLTDGDSVGLEGRKKKLDEACVAQQIPGRRSDEHVALIVPCWNIETWLSYLGGEDVDENVKIYPRLTKASDCQPAVVALNQMCKAGDLRQPAPPSLLDACQEFKRLDLEN